MTPGPRDQHVLKVFPTFPVLFEVDFNGDLLPFLVSQVLDSVHHFHFLPWLIAIQF